MDFLALCIQPLSDRYHHFCNHFIRRTEFVAEDDSVARCPEGLYDPWRKLSRNDPHWG